MAFRDGGRRMNALELQPLPETLKVEEQVFRVLISLLAVLSERLGDNPLQFGR